MTVREMVDRFVAIEKKQGLMGCSVSGYFFWPYMRFNVFQVLQRKLIPECGVAHPDFVAGSYKGKRFSVCRAIWRRIGKMVAAFRYDPCFSFRRCPLLFALEPRVMPVAGRGNVPVMLDFIAELLDVPFGVLSYAAGKRYAELPRHYRQFRPAASIVRKFFCKRGVRNPAVSERVANEVERAVSYIASGFGVELPVAELVALALGQMTNYRIYGPVFEKYLKRLGVKCLVTSVHYHPLNMLLGEKAKELGIRRIELMHGRVSPEHIAYNLPEQDGRYIPDELFVWGEFWRSHAEAYPLHRCVVTGYPLFDYVRDRYPRVISSRKKRVLFISQGNVGTVLSRMAVALAEVLPKDRFSVRYKFHPSESGSWKTLYPWLLDSDVEVLDNRSVSVYEELAAATVTVGSFSTALIEGFAWGVKALVLRDCPFSDIMEPFQKLGLVSFVSDCSELVHLVTEIEDEMVSPGIASQMFASGAAKNIASRLCRDVRGENEDMIPSRAATKRQNMIKEML